ncbi:hypothetical protein H7347_02120 [Corynebacterium sp. zg-331]|uniref:Rv2732c family membrane protein n=1 Tax=unclassified Corynebacterium TaxID=2624378 RepID=UPI00128DCB7E|nr:MULTISPECIES: hypothetical protein [unclassified Corynebacterium]MBC3185384.1 hypothetical protein [Corynebacterium sp. zg-331]MPV51881.1 hypothetical protein [Corynebacterium sp. zg331]
MAETRREEHSAAHLAELEREAASRLWLGTPGYALLGAFVFYVASLFLPQVTGVAGYQVVFATDTAAQAGVKITEYIFAICAFLGLGVCTALALVLRRTVWALVAWMLCTVAAVEALLALWLRQTRSGSEEATSAGVGMYLAIGAVLVAVVVYSRIALRRSPEQERIAQARAEVEDLDEVSYAQRTALVKQQQRGEQHNPLLVDDRRARAAHRAEHTRSPRGEE